MGILTEDELEGIKKQLQLDTFGRISYIPYMKKEGDTIVYDRTNEMVYFIHGSFDDCYKKQTKNEFIETIKELKKEGWKKI